MAFNSGNSLPNRFVENWRSRNSSTSYNRGSYDHYSPSSDGDQSHVRRDLNEEVDDIHDILRQHGTYISLNNGSIISLRQDVDNIRQDFDEHSQHTDTRQTLLANQLQLVDGQMIIVGELMQHGKDRFDTRIAEQMALNEALEAQIDDQAKQLQILQAKVASQDQRFRHQQNMIDNLAQVFQRLDQSNSIPHHGPASTVPGEQHALRTFHIMRTPERSTHNDSEGGETTSEFVCHLEEQTTRVVNLFPFDSDGSDASSTYLADAVPNSSVSPHTPSRSSSVGLGLGSHPLANGFREFFRSVEIWARQYATFPAVRTYRSGRLRNLSRALNEVVGRTVEGQKMLNEINERPFVVTAIVNNDLVKKVLMQDFTHRFDSSLGEEYAVMVARNISFWRDHPTDYVGRGANCTELAQLAVIAMERPEFKERVQALTSEITRSIFSKIELLVSEDMASVARNALSQVVSNACDIAIGLAKQPAEYDMKFPKFGDRFDEPNSTVRANDGPVSSQRFVVKICCTPVILEKTFTNTMTATCIHRGDILVAPKKGADRTRSWQDPETRHMGGYHGSAGSPQTSSASDRSGGRDLRTSGGRGMDSP